MFWPGYPIDVAISGYCVIQYFQSSSSCLSNISVCLDVCDAHAATIAAKTSPRRRWRLIVWLEPRRLLFSSGKPDHDLPDRFVVRKDLPHRHTAVTGNGLPRGRRFPTVCGVEPAIMGAGSSCFSKNSHN